MLTKSDREIFHRLLDYLGVELQLRSWRGGLPDKENASSNIFQLWSKSMDRPLLAVSVNRSSLTYARLADNASEAARFLLEECVGLIETSPPQPSRYVPNPFFGCSSLEAAALKLDLLTGCDKAVKGELEEDDHGANQKRRSSKICSSSRDFLLKNPCHST